MQTIWLSPTEYVTGDPSLQISYPHVSHPSSIVTCLADPGDLKWISMGLQLPPNASIDEVIVCYEVSNSQSFISQVRLAEMNTPDQALVIHDDGTDLNSTSPVCYISDVGGKVPTPGAAVTLALRLNFEQTSDEIMLGAVGVKIQASGELCANVRDFGAKGDGTDATNEIQDAIDFVALTSGGTVCVPPGLYILSRALDLNDKVHLKGSGHHVTTLKLQDHISPTAQQFLAGESSLIRIMGKQDVTVSGLRIDGNKDQNDFLGCQAGFLCQNRQFGIMISSDQPFAPGLGVRSKHCVIENCWVENCVVDGIHVTKSRDITIRDCASHNNGIVLPAPTPYYLQCPGCVQATVDYIMAYDCNFVPYEPFGIILAGNTERCVVERCSAFGNPHGGIECFGQSSQYHQIRYCEADSIHINAGSKPPAAHPVHHSIVGCFVDNRRKLFRTRSMPGECIGFRQASDVTVRDCHCVTAMTPGITGGGVAGDDAKGIAIINNRIERADPVLPGNLAAACTPDPPFAGINMSHLSDAIISNNTLTGEFTAPAGGAAIRITESRRVSVTGNSARGVDEWDGGPIVEQTRGILAIGCEALSVTANTMSGFTWGVDEQSSQNNTVTGNILSHNQIPVNVDPSSIYTANII